MRNRILVGVAAAVLAVGCGEDAPQERQQIEAAGEQAGDELQEAAGAVGDAAQEAGEELQEAAGKATAEVRDEVNERGGEGRDTLIR